RDNRAPDQPLPELDSRSVADILALVGKQASPNSVPDENLAAAIKSGDLLAVQAAAESMELARSDELRTYVLRHGSFEIASYLHRRAQLGIDELQLAVIGNDREAVERLVEKKPNRPPLVLLRDVESPLRLAIWRGNVSIVKLLLERNVAVNEVVPTYNEPWRAPSPLVEAIRQGNAEIVRMLIDAGSRLDDPRTVLVPVDGAIHKGRPVRELLASYDWKSLAEDADHEQLAKERESLVQELHDKGLLKRVENSHNPVYMPLAEAIYAGRATVVSVLLKAGVNPNISIDGQTRPLHIAIKQGHPGIVKLLIEAGADVNHLDTNGKTPLGLGYYQGDIADMLRAAGARDPR
ncbi:MAG: ankyrin repeat domain-containing protein, partial [Planctomycetales bacterium]|nr:ankyrin repeat domain-containing protein [Planctomycetales bacterium]